MTDVERELIDKRVEKAMQQWPTLTEAFGCLDCDNLFRRAEGHCCPLCGSQSVLNVSEFFNEARLKAQRDT